MQFTANDKIINIIDNVITSKPNGNQLLEIMKDNNILYKIIKSENIKICWAVWCRLKWENQNKKA